MWSETSSPCFSRRSTLDSASSTTFSRSPSARSDRSAMPRGYPPRASGNPFGPRARTGSVPATPNQTRSQAMSLKSLPVRAPASKVLPRKRSVGERIVTTLELAAVVRTVSRVIGRKKRSRVPGKRGLLTIAGGAVLAVVIGALLAKKKSGGSEAPAPQSAATPSPAKPEPAKPEPPKPQASKPEPPKPEATKPEPEPEKSEPEPPAPPEPPTAESAPVKAAVAAAEKLDEVDGVGEGASGPTPADNEDGKAAS